jgi:hypothetical protein
MPTSRKASDPAIGPSRLLRGARPLLVALAVLAASAAMRGAAAPAALAADPVAPAVARIPPIASGMARVWFLRQFVPSEGLRTPMIFVNGAPLASSLSGTVFYRDFAAGAYTFTVETCTIDSNQAAALNLAPGSQTDLEIQSLSSFYSWGCLANDTFYVRPISPAWAQTYFPQLTYLGAR